jgi:aspartyl-tRNA(Asn)/glutamyl-tRNA(Gln) amidotransferase subunit C
MLEIKDIEKLAKLARIELTHEEKEKLLKEVDPILNYVAQLKEVSSKIENTPRISDHKNIMRGDDVWSEGGINTEAIIKNMPESQRNYLKVKKIL